MTTQLEIPASIKPALHPPNIAIEYINIQNLLSFGADGLSADDGLELLPLNVLIGPNGSGKSNFIDVISLLQAAARDLTQPFVELQQGVGEWIWRGTSGSKAGSVSVVVNYWAGTQFRHNDWLRYWLKIAEGSQHELIVNDERLENKDNEEGRDTFKYLLYQNGIPMLGVKVSANNNLRKLRREDMDVHQSVLSRRWEAGLYPEVAYVGQLFDSFRLYRDWTFGRKSPVRHPTPITANSTFLDEDANNLASVLRKMLVNPQVEAKLTEYLAYFNKNATGILVDIQERTLFQTLFLREGNALVPAGRVSDGTLHWLALLAVLLHPDPPRLICLEEPEIGLHPNIIPILADLLRQAATRTQLLITTHSVELVDQFTSSPEVVLVCENQGEATVMRRLSADQLSNWLDDYTYTLGQLWQMDVFGGNK